MFNFRQARLLISNVSQRANEQGGKRCVLSIKEVCLTHERPGFNYAVYNYFGDQAGIILVGCLAHGTRKFIDAILNRKDIATHVLTGIQKNIRNGKASL